MDKRRYIIGFGLFINQFCKQAHDREGRLFSGTVVTMVSCHRAHGLFLRCTDASQSAMPSRARHWLGIQHATRDYVCFILFIFLFFITTTQSMYSLLSAVIGDIWCKAHYSKKRKRNKINNSSFINIVKN